MIDEIKIKSNILDNNPDDLCGIVSSYGEKSFRGKQVFEWLGKGVSSFDEMRNIPKSLREKLAADYYLALPEVIKKQISAIDGTQKCLLEFVDGERVESVFMKYSYGNSLCISSQVGCRMGCTFCASGKAGFVRNLSAGEMLSEVLQMRNTAGEDIRHIVVMGIGEPFDNYNELSRFLRIINEPRGYNLSMRNITVSTSGVVPVIYKFAEDFPQVNLAVSLHAPNDEIRKKMMPVAKKYGYDELLSTCKEYTEITSRRITFEYALVQGVNDSESDARLLASRLKGWRNHVNLILLNEIEGTKLASSARADAERFKAVLESKGIAVTLRRTLGADIDAACGQLRLRR